MDNLSFEARRPQCEVRPSGTVPSEQNRGSHHHCLEAQAPWLSSSQLHLLLHYKQIHLGSCAKWYERAVQAEYPCPPAERGGAVLPEEQPRPLQLAWLEERAAFTPGQPGVKALASASMPPGRGQARVLCKGQHKPHTHHQSQTILDLSCQLPAAPPLPFRALSLSSAHSPLPGCCVRGTVYILRQQPGGRQVPGSGRRQETHRLGSHRALFHGDWGGSLSGCPIPPQPQGDLIHSPSTV